MKFSPNLSGDISPFWTGAICSNLAWLTIWPLEPWSQRWIPRPLPFWGSIFHHAFAACCIASGCDQKPTPKWQLRVQDLRFCLTPLTYIWFKFDLPLIYVGFKSWKNVAFVCICGKKSRLQLVCWTTSNSAGVAFHYCGRLLRTIVSSVACCQVWHALRCHGENRVTFFQKLRGNTRVFFN